MILDHVKPGSLRPGEDPGPRDPLWWARRVSVASGPGPEAAARPFGRLGRGAETGRGPGGLGRGPGRGLSAPPSAKPPRCGDM